MLARCMRRTRKNNLEIRIAGFSSRPQKDNGKSSPIVPAGAISLSFLTTSSLFNRFALFAA